MSTSPTEGRLALVPVRLSDLPKKVRSYGIREFLRRDGEIAGIAALLDNTKVEQAALYPSDRVYWIPEVAYRKVERRFHLDRA